jgi:hypothetical protein
MVGMANHGCRLVIGGPWHGAFLVEKEVATWCWGWTVRYWTKVVEGNVVSSRAYAILGRSPVQYHDHDIISGYGTLLRGF